MDRKISACGRRISGQIAVLCLALLASACTAPAATRLPNNATPTRASSNASATRVLIAGVAKENVNTLEPALDAAWAGIKPGGDIVWSPARTPFFASEAPPTARTIWTSYAFAYGAPIDGKLADGQHVAKPWAKIVYDVNNHTFTANILSTELEDSGQIQGVRPLNAETAALLNRADAFRGWVLEHEKWPQWNAELQDLQQYYITWSANNGVIVSLIENDHVEFIQRWVNVTVN